MARHAGGLQDSVGIRWRRNEKMCELSSSRSRRLLATAGPAPACECSRSLPAGTCLGADRRAPRPGIDGLALSCSGAPPSVRRPAPRNRLQPDGGPPRRPSGSQDLHRLRLPLSRSQTGRAHRANLRESAGCRRQADPPITRERLDMARAHVAEHRIEARRIDAGRGRTPVHGRTAVGGIAGGLCCPRDRRPCFMAPLPRSRRRKAYNIRLS